MIYIFQPLGDGSDPSPFTWFPLLRGCCCVYSSRNVALFIPFPSAAAVVALHSCRNVAHNASICTLTLLLFPFFFLCFPPCFFVKNVSAFAAVAWDQIEQRRICARHRKTKRRQTAKKFQANAGRRKQALTCFCRLKTNKKSLHLLPALAFTMVLKIQNGRTCPSR